MESLLESLLESAAAPQGWILLPASPTHGDFSAKPQSDPRLPRTPCQGSQTVLILTQGLVDSWWIPGGFSQHQCTAAKGSSPGLQLQHLKIITNMGDTRPGLFRGSRALFLEWFSLWSLGGDKGCPELLHRFSCSL